MAYGCADPDRRIVSGRRWVLLALLLSTRYFVETSHYLYEPGLRYWPEHGGLPGFGYPISERLEAEQGCDRTQRF